MSATSHSSRSAEMVHGLIVTALTTHPIVQDGTGRPLDPNEARHAATLLIDAMLRYRVVEPARKDPAKQGKRGKSGQTSKRIKPVRQP